MPVIRVTRPRRPARPRGRAARRVPAVVRTIHLPRRRQTLVVLDQHAVPQQRVHLLGREGLGGGRVGRRRVVVIQYRPGSYAFAEDRGRVRGVGPADRAVEVGAFAAAARFWSGREKYISDFKRRRE